jgi:non-homologous end joining protein Ku
MYKALAPAPERSTTSMTLAWGVVTIPCSIYTGTEPVSVARKEFLADGTPVGRVSINKTTGQFVDRSIVVKMAESTSGVWVELDDDEIAACTTDKGLATIVSFVPNAKVNSEYLLDGLNQVRPKRVKGKVDPAGNKALALLLETMKARKVHALVSVALRGPARYAVIDHNGDMRWVVTADAIRNHRDLPTAVITDAERAAAASLIDAIGVSTPTLIDTTAQAVQDFVDAKAAGMAPSFTAAPEIAPADLMADLLASIAAEKGTKAS